MEDTLSKNKRILGPQSDDHKRKIAEAQSREKSVHWKGDNISKHSTLHQYVRKYLPMPELCQECNKVPPRDLANITGIYNRDFSNWAYWCKSCHQRYDIKKGFRTSDNLFKKGQTAWNKGKKIPYKPKPSMKGKTPWNKGKTEVYSNEARMKMGAANKGRIPWNKK